MNDTIRIALNSFSILLLAIAVIITSNAGKQLRDRVEALEANQVTVQEEVSEVCNND